MLSEIWWNNIGRTELKYRNSKTCKEIITFILFQLFKLMLFMKISYYMPIYLEQRAFLKHIFYYYYFKYYYITYYFKFFIGYTDSGSLCFS